MGIYILYSVEKQSNYGEGHCLKKALIFTLTALIIFQLSSCGVENISETNISEQMQEIKSEEVSNYEISEENIKSQLAQFSIEKIPEWNYQVNENIIVEPQKEIIYSFMGSDKTLKYEKTESFSYSFCILDSYFDENTNEHFEFINGTNNLAYDETKFALGTTITQGICIEGNNTNTYIS